MMSTFFSCKATHRNLKRHHAAVLDLRMLWAMSPLSARAYSLSGAYVEEALIAAFKRTQEQGGKKADCGMCLRREISKGSDGGATLSSVTNAGAGIEQAALR